MAACSGDMLLEALVACAGVTLAAIATAINIELRDATIRAEGDLNFRGTLGVAKDAPVGFRQMRLSGWLKSGIILLWHRPHKYRASGAQIAAQQDFTRII